MATNLCPQWPPIFLSLAIFIGSHAKSAPSPSPPGSSAAANGLPPGARPSLRPSSTLLARCGGYKSTARAVADDLQHHPRLCSPPHRQTFTADTQRHSPNPPFVVASALGGVPSDKRSRFANTFIFRILLACHSSLQELLGSSFASRNRRTRSWRGRDVLVRPRHPL